MRLTLALLALIAATGCACAEDDDDKVFRKGDWVIDGRVALVIRSDGGGNIHDYADLIDTLQHRPVLILGSCKSSCTMFLSLPLVCIAPTASFGFHGPSSDDDSIRHLLSLVDKIASYHPPAIAEHFRTDWGLTRDFTWLTGAEVLAMDPSLQPCE